MRRHPNRRPTDHIENQKPEALRDIEGRGGGRLSVQCLDLPGCISEGETKEEALRNIREAIEGYMEAFPQELELLKRKRELVKLTV